MTSNFDDFEREQVEKLHSNAHQDNSDLDYFELLSAYLDEELTPAARNRVQCLLDNDPNIKKIYTQLLFMHNQMQNLAVPPSISTKQLSENVFHKIEQTQRKRKALLWGGAIATACLATLSGFIPGINSPAFKVAQSPSQPTFSQPIMVAVAVDKPAVKIPKAASSNYQHNKMIDN